MSDGYCDCACRDCGEIAIGKAGDALCHGCEEAGCDNDPRWPAVECQAPHAYCAGDSTYDDQDGVCTVCGQPF